MRCGAVSGSIGSCRPPVWRAAAAWTPSFTIVAVLSLALGIGANTAIFQVINAVRLRALPVSHPAALAHIQISDIEGARGSFDSRYPTVTNPIWEQLRADQQAFSGMLAWNRGTFNLTPGGVARRVRGLWVSGSFFDVLGVGPAAGRLLTPADDTRGCAPRAVVSHGFWQREFGGRPDAIGSTLTVDGLRFEVIGVSKAGFNGVEVGRGFDIAVPICTEPAFSSGEGRLASGTDWWLVVMGRLQPGWTIDAASEHLATISPALFGATIAPNYPAASVAQYRAFKLRATPGALGTSGLREYYQMPLLVLLGIAAVVLIIACVNLANLLLARASAREREFSVRLGLGASRGRIVRQLLVESMLLASIGAGCGAFLASFLSRSLVGFLDDGEQQVLLDLGFDLQVLAFTAGAAVLTCLLFGLAPAIRATRAGSDGLLRGAGRGLTASRERFILRRGLVTLQVALAVLLAAGAALFTRTLVNLGNVNPGFDADGVVAASLDLRATHTARDAEHALHAALLDRLRAVPGVQGVATAAVVPISGNTWGNRVWMERYQTRPARQVRVSTGSARTTSRRSAFRSSPDGTSRLLIRSPPPRSPSSTKRSRERWAATTPSAGGSRSSRRRAVRKRQRSRSSAWLGTRNTSTFARLPGRWPISAAARRRGQGPSFDWSPGTTCHLRSWPRRSPARSPTSIQASSCRSRR